MDPLVSIITPVYNNDEYISRAYNSIKCQSIKSWEWIVIEDASTDNSYHILKSITENDERVKIIKNPLNLGAGISRNNGLNKTRGKYVAFLDADDAWMPKKLEKQLEIMKQGAHISFSPFYKSNPQKSSKKIYDLTAPKNLNYRQLLAKKATFGCSTVMVRASAISESRMSENRTGQDYLFWLDILRQGSIAVKADEVLSIIYVHPSSISYNKINKARVQWKIYRQELNFSIFKSVFYFLCYAYHAVFRP